MKTKTLVAVAVVFTALFLSAWSTRLSRTGLTLRLMDADGSVLAVHPHANLGTSRIDAWVALRPQLIQAEWTGFWDAPSPGLSELILRSDGAASVQLDDGEVFEVGSSGTRVRPAAPIAAGLHGLRVSYRSLSSKDHEVFLKGLTADGVSVNVERARLTPSLPSAFDAVLRLAAPAAGLGALVVWLWLLARAFRGGGRELLVAKAPPILLSAVVLIGLALRFEALVTVYWDVEAPDWADAMAAEIRSARPGSFEHEPTSTPYAGDPFSYLQIARSMGSFYEPSSREPLFPVLTRLALFLAHGKDIGINFLSALSSTLVCVALFFLGRRLQSPWAGLLAALLWAIEWQAISLSVQGWRDDLFALEVVVCATALVALYDKPSPRAIACLSIAGGLTLLTRLTAFSFLLPGLVAVALLPGPIGRPDRARASFFAFLIMMLLVGPFMIACALGFGDPFYSVNVHAAFYRGRAGLSGTGGSSVTQLFSQLLSPWEFVQTGFIGLTSFPFENKWFGLGALVPGLGRITRILSLLGLPLLLWRTRGWIALLVAFFSIVPYAWTWNIPGGDEWRFTLPAYPFYLISAAIAVESVVTGVALLFRKEERRRAAFLAGRFVATAALLFGFYSWTTRSLEWFRVKSQIAHGKAAVVMAGPAASNLFDEGWVIEPRPGGALFSMTGNRARVVVPLAASSLERIVLRSRLNEDPVPTVHLSGAEVEMHLSDDPAQKGLGWFAMPMTPTPGRAERTLEIEFVADPAARGPYSILWIRFEPKAPR